MLKIVSNYKIPDLYNTYQMLRLFFCLFFLIVNTVILLSQTIPKGSTHPLGEHKYLEPMCDVDTINNRYVSFFRIFEERSLPKGKLKKGIAILWGKKYQVIKSIPTYISLSNDQDSLVQSYDYSNHLYTPKYLIYTGHCNTLINLGYSNLEHLPNKRVDSLRINDTSVQSSKKIQNSPQVLFQPNRNDSISIRSNKIMDAQVENSVQDQNRQELFNADCLNNHVIDENGNKGIDCDILLARDMRFQFSAVGDATIKGITTSFADAIPNNLTLSGITNYDRLVSIGSLNLINATGQNTIWSGRDMEGDLDNSFATGRGNYVKGLQSIITGQGNNAQDFRISLLYSFNGDYPTRVTNSSVGGNGNKLDGTTANLGLLNSVLGGQLTTMEDVRNSLILSNKSNLDGTIATSTILGNNLFLEDVIGSFINGENSDYTASSYIMSVSRAVGPTKTIINNSSVGIYGLTGSEVSTVNRGFGIGQGNRIANANNTGVIGFNNDSEAGNSLVVGQEQRDSSDNSFLAGAYNQLPDQMEFSSILGVDIIPSVIEKAQTYVNYLHLTGEDTTIGNSTLAKDKPGPKVMSNPTEILVLDPLDDWEVKRVNIASFLTQPDLFPGPFKNDAEASANNVPLKSAYYTPTGDLRIRIN